MVFGLFGKRAPQAKPAGIPGPPPGLDKIIPDELWQGEMGKLLRAAGLNPDDESNLVQTPDRVAARIARDQETFQAKLMKTNDEIVARTGGGYVQPFFLFPQSCWNGETGHFLTARMGMSPYEDWNVALLPPEEKWCAALGLPRHPNADQGMFEKDVDEFLRAKMAQMDAFRQECDRTHDFATFKQRQDDMKALIRDFAGWLNKQYADIWNQHVAKRAAA